MIARDDAAAALASVDTARARAGELRGYAHAGDILIAWGLVWLVCNLLTHVFVWGAQSWPFGVALAVVWSIVRGRRGHGDARAGLTSLVVFAGVALIMLVTGVRDPMTANVAISLTVAAAYVVIGIWTGARFAWIGLALAALVLAGWFVDRTHLYLWLGLGGGGALLLSGWWLRRA